MPFILGIINKKTQFSFPKQITLPEGYNIETKIEHTENGIYVLAGGNNKEKYKVQLVRNQNSLGILIGKFFCYKNKEDEIFQNLDINSFIRNKSIIEQNIWGNYCGFIFDINSKYCGLIRDPMGLSNLFYINVGKQIIFASSIKLLYHTVKLLEIDFIFDYNLSYLCSFVSFGAYPSSFTPFNKIHEVLPGNIVVYKNDSNSQSISFHNVGISKFNLDNKENIEDEIYKAFNYSVRCWAEYTKGICLEFSGGLDSTALLLELKGFYDNKKIIAVNYYHPKIGNSYNEYLIAKNIATENNITFQALNWQNSLPLSAPNNIYKNYNRPISSLIDQKLDEELNNIATSFGNYEYMNGLGGDHLFLAAPIIESMWDYCLAYGFKDIKNKLLEFSSFYRMPIFKMVDICARSVFSFYLRNKNFCKFHLSNEEWMNKEFKSLFGFDIFKSNDPRFKNISKAIHYNIINTGKAYLDHGLRNEFCNILSPFYSEPLFNLALNIPAYSTFNKDFDRILFRKALNKKYNSQHLWRRYKGDTTGVLELGLQTNKKRLLELCLEGKLASFNLINRDMLYNSLKELLHGKNIDNWPLINLISTEIWFESWSDKIR